MLHCNNCWKKTHQSTQFYNFIRGSRGGTGVQTHPEKSQKLGFLNNTGPDLLKNHKAAKPAFNVGPSSARQRMAFHWQDDGGPLIASFGPYPSPNQLKR